MNRIFRALLSVLFVLGIAKYAEAGPVEIPLEAQLDLASDVVVGRVTKIVPVKENAGDGSHGGRITVEVRETLKGRPAKTLQFLGVTSLDPDWGGGQHYHGYQLGEDGIWVIANGWGPRGGCLPKDKKVEVVTDLKNLKERKWSQPVNGLRAWAAVTDSGLRAWEGVTDSVIIFAVKNDSNTELFVPYETETGFVTATVTNGSDIPTGLVFRPNDSRSEVVSCQKLAPGELVYLHPDYSSINLARGQHLAPGTYSVVISCKNDRTKAVASPNDSGSPVSVKAWQGEVSAPAVKLTIALSQEEIGAALAHLEKIDRDTLHCALTSGQFRLRTAAARRLGEVGDFTSIPLLIAALSEPSEHVGSQDPEAWMASTRYWVNDSLKKLTKHDFGFRWDAPKADREAAIKRWSQWYETAGKLQDALTTAWKQIQALKHPLLAGISNVKPSVTEDEHGLVNAEIEFVRNAVWEPKRPRLTSPDPLPVDAKQTYIFIQVSLSRPSPLSQPHARSRALRVHGADYDLLNTVAASDIDLKEHIESILNGAFNHWRTDKPASLVTNGPPMPALRPLTDIADETRKVLPLGWSLKVSKNVIRIECKEKVRLLGPGLPGMSPGESDAEYAHKNGYLTKYEIELTIVPRLSAAQLERIREERRPLEQSFEIGANDKAKASKLAHELDKHPLPMFYTDDYSIFVKWPYGFYGVYPPGAAVQVDRLVASLKKIFREYKSAPTAE